MIGSHRANDAGSLCGALRFKHISKAKPFGPQNSNYNDLERLGLGHKTVGLASTP